MRRAIRDVLKPNADVKIHARTMRSFELATGLLLPQALPVNRYIAATPSEVAIRGLLECIWDINGATAATLRQLQAALGKF